MPNGKYIHGRFGRTLRISVAEDDSDSVFEDNTDSSSNINKLPEIVFPEVEEMVTRNGKLVSKGDPPKPEVRTQARKNFGRLAFKVLAQVMQPDETGMYTLKK